MRPYFTAWRGAEPPIVVVVTQRITFSKEFNNKYYLQKEINHIHLHGSYFTFDGLLFVTLLWWNVGCVRGKVTTKNAFVESCTNKCLTPIWLSIWHLWRGRLEHESQILPAAAWDSPEQNACDPSMRNSQELSAEIKLICRPQAWAYEHVTNIEIGFVAPTFPLLMCSL